jgi:ubiquinone/menaquinone biosynthesis C-methylase UbiE
MRDDNDPTRITMDTYSHIASHYAHTHSAATRSESWHKYLQHFADAVRSSTIYKADPSLPVLDVGCGPGRDSLLLAQMGFNVIAADLSEAMLDEARKCCQDQPFSERITFRRMDMRTLDLPDASCAGLWVSASFLHIPKRENLAVLTELARVLAAAAPLMLLVKESDSADDERYEAHQESGKLRFFSRYRGGELWTLLEQAGLKVLEITTSVDTRFTDGRRWLAALCTKS